jgi:hypothetical protein
MEEEEEEGEGDYWMRIQVQTHLDGKQEEEDHTWM